MGQAPLPQLIMCTDFFGWKVCGFNIYNHRSGFKKWIKVNRPLFGGLIEAHVKKPKEQKFIRDVLPGWNFADNYDYSDLRKIWVVCHPTVRVTILETSLQMITADVLLPDSTGSIIVSLVYASNDDEV